MCNAGTDFTGSATAVRLVVFQFRESVAPAGWYALNLNSGFSDPITFAAKVKKVVTLVTTTPFTLTAAMMWNGRVFASASAAVINAEGVVEGMEFTLVTHLDTDVDLNPDDLDQISLDGETADTAGDAVRLTNKGEILTCTGISTSVWNCSTDAGVAQ